ncbi:MAG: cohesin domain-containing protein, partial [bacterium]
MMEVVMLWREWLTKLFVVAAVIAFVVTAVFAQTSVSVAPATKNVLPGTSFSLTFSVALVPPIHGYHLDVDYDNTILQYNGASSGTFLTPFLWLPSPNGPHTIYVATALAGSGTSVSGSGTLFTMQFTAIGAGVSPITLTTVELRKPDNSGNITPVTINSGSVTVGNPNDVFVDQTYSSGS